MKKLKRQIERLKKQIKEIDESVFEEVSELEFEDGYIDYFNFIRLKATLKAKQEDLKLLSSCSGGEEWKVK